MVSTFNDYTVFAVNCRNEQLGDALLVDGSHLVAAIDALTDYWEAQQDENDRSHGVHTEVHEGSVRDCNDWRPFPWQPGEPVLTPTSRPSGRDEAVERLGRVLWRRDFGGLASRKAIQTPAGSINR